MNENKTLVIIVVAVLIFILANVYLITESEKNDCSAQIEMLNQEIEFLHNQIDILKQNE